MPIFMYSTSTNSVLSILSMPTLCVACVFLLLDRNRGMHFFDVTHGGSTLLRQQLFWFFAHPWVYITFLPATGMSCMILPVLAPPDRALRLRRDHRLVSADPPQTSLTMQGQRVFPEAGRSQAPSRARLSAEGRPWRARR